MGDRAPHLDSLAGGPAALDELVAEPALADSGLGHDAHHLAVARGRLLQRGVERLYVGAATHEARQAARARDVETRLQLARARELEDVHRLGDALDRELAEIVEREVAGDEVRGGVRQVAGVGLCQTLHALGQADRVTLGGVVHAQVVADPADHDFARVQAQTRRDADTVLALDLARAGL